MSQIGGSQRVREDLERALEAGRKVTAKVQWISKPAQDTRSRWIHCTPLLGVNSLIAVWMVILVDDIEEKEKVHLQEPVKPPLSYDPATTITEALPWEAVEKPDYPGAIGHGFVEGSGSSNASQAALSNDGGRSPYDPTPPVPERNRLRKEKPNNIRLPSSPSRGRAMAATVSPFAHKNDTRYDVKVWSDAEDYERKQSMDSTAKIKRPGPRYGEPPDIVGKSVHPPMPIRPGPRINGKAYSFNSNSEHGISADDDEARATGAAEDRPMSRGSSLTPSTTPSIRNTGPPTKPPINLPGGPDPRTSTESRPPTRKTYKSLSPYGVLFQD